MTDLLDTMWARRVRAGDFAAIPEDVDFGSAVDLAMIIDGYDLTGGASKCSAILRRVMKKRLEEDHSGAPALDLWVALFYAHRGHRHAGTWPDDVELWVLDGLTLELRAALLALTPRQKAGIMAAMRSAPPSNSAEAGHE